MAVDDPAGEHSFPAYGENKRDQLLKRWYNGLNLTKESLYALTGFGDGTHIRYFLSESSAGTNCLIAERRTRHCFARLLLIMTAPIFYQMNAASLG